MENNKLTKFKSEDVEFVETNVVTNGVSCDVYKFKNTTLKDLAIITVDVGARTPTQKITEGTKTIEGHISGQGVLTVTDSDDNSVKHTNPLSLEVNIGQIMSWMNSGDCNLIFYEICYPPYQDGRFKNLKN